MSYVHHAELPAVATMVPSLSEHLLLDGIASLGDEGLGGATGFSGEIDPAHFEGHFGFDDVDEQGESLPRLLPGVKIGRLLEQTTAYIALLEHPYAACAPVTHIEEISFMQPVLPGDMVETMVDPAMNTERYYVLAGAALVAGRAVAQATLSGELWSRGLMQEAFDAAQTPRAEIPQHDGRLGAACAGHTTPCATSVAQRCY